MPRKLKALLLAACLALWPGVVWGQNEACTLCTGDLGPIGTWSTDCGDHGVGKCVEADRVPDGDDGIIIPVGHTADIIADITYTTDGASLTVNGALTASAVDQQDAILITLPDGQDGLTTVETATEYNQVALYTATTSTLSLTGGYLEVNADAVPNLLATASVANKNIGVVDKVALCDLADANSPGGVVGGANADCATGVQEFGFTLAYTDDRNNPGKDTDGDNFLDHFVGAIDTDFYACFLSGMDKGHCYQVYAVDSTLAIYNISLDVRQLTTDYALDSATFPLATRGSVLTTVDAADGYNPVVGDYCVETEADLLATLGDGGYVGAFLWMCDADNTDCDERPRRIVKTLDDVDCAGGANVGHAAIWVAKENAFMKDYDEEADIVITAIGAGRGDQYVILAPVILTCAAGVETAGDCKVIIEGDATLSGVILAGSAQLVMMGDGAWTLGQQVHVFGSGEDGLPEVHFTSRTGSIALSWWSIVGGPDDADSASAGFLFEDISGVTSLYQVNARHIGGDAFGTAGDAMGPARLERLSCERVGYTGAGIPAAVDCIANDSDWSSLGVVDLHTTDPVYGDEGSIISSGTVTTVVNGLGISGQTQGRINVGLALGQTDYNVLARGVVGGGKTHITSLMQFADIDDASFTLGMSTNNVDDSIISNTTTANDAMIDMADLLGHESVSRNLFYNLTSSSAECNAATDTCYIVEVAFDADETTIPTIEDNTWTADAGFETRFNSFVYSSQPVVPADGAINFGGNLVDNLYHAVDNTAVTAIDLSTNAATYSVQRDGRNNCVSNVATAFTDGGETILYVDDIDQYTVMPLLGIAPEYLDAENGNYVQVRGSYLDTLNCGVLPRPRHPGLRPGHSHLYERMGIPDPYAYRVDLGD